ncbi:MAG: NAD(P)-dependent oxidoreductase [Rhodospirillales bacterium]|nr:NAD(P)-dependent oxidoreductase [Rhodospirillales bacterium]
MGAVVKDKKKIDGRIAFIGFGEAAQAFLTGWRTVAEVAVDAYDIKTDQTETRIAKQEDYRMHGIGGGTRAVEVVQGAPFVFSAVTADASLDAAESVVPAIEAGALYLDINSVSPNRKRTSADLIAATGALYVDVAVMAPVHPKLHRTPLLISGPGAEKAARLLDHLDMKFELISEKVGDASVIKMIRSVLVKGFESLMVESVMAAVKAGVDERILNSLGNVYPGMDMAKHAGYMMERVMVHGRRRAAEMREVEKTLQELGIDGFMAAATARRQDWFVDLGAAADFPGGVPEDYLALAQAALLRLEARKPS